MSEVKPSSGPSNAVLPLRGRQGELPDEEVLHHDLDRSGTPMIKKEQDTALNIEQDTALRIEQHTPMIKIEPDINEHKRPLELSGKDGEKKRAKKSGNKQAQPTLPEPICDRVWAATKVKDLHPLVISRSDCQAIFDHVVKQGQDITRPCQIVKACDEFTQNKVAKRIYYVPRKETEHGDGKHIVGFKFKILMPTEAHYDVAYALFGECLIASSTNPSKKGKGRYMAKMANSIMNRAFVFSSKSKPELHPTFVQEIHDFDTPCQVPESFPFEGWKVVVYMEDWASKKALPYLIVLYSNTEIILCCPRFFFEKEKISYLHFSCSASDENVP